MAALKNIQSHTLKIFYKIAKFHGVYLKGFVVRIQLKILHDIDKRVFLVVIKFRSDTTSHFSAVTE